MFNYIDIYIHILYIGIKNYKSTLHDEDHGYFCFNKKAKNKLTIILTLNDNKNNCFIFVYYLIILTDTSSIHVEQLFLLNHCTSFVVLK